MILVEVVELVVNVDWAFDFLFNDLEVHFTGALSEFVIAKVFVILFQLYDLVGHNVQHHSDSKEDNTENREGKHCAHGSWHWPPGWQGLLLELGLLKLFNLFTNPLFFVR